MQVVELVLTPEEALQEDRFLSSLYDKLGLPQDGSVVVVPLRRSIDARGRTVCVRVQCEVYGVGEEPPVEAANIHWQDVRHAQQVIIVGAGPAGLFAAIRLIELGIKPVVLERGKDVQARRRDLALINKEHLVNPESNYCFGEGGAGTYSDGKLYTRSGKRGNIRRILNLLVAHGAPAAILYDAHPHIGTNKLPRVIQQIRETILAAGGEIHFNTRVDDLVCADGVVQGVILQSGDKMMGEGVILATGHSARDVFTWLDQKKVSLEAKPFALGVRVEHAQRLIDRMQYHCTSDRGPYLPASAYSFVHQAQVGANTRGVFSFCMCPGGFIVPSATAPGELVVNGMSPSRRDSVYANSGIVVAVEARDFEPYAQFGPLAGMHFQQAIEQAACRAAGGTQTAPAQRMDDFVAGRVSASLLPTSYQPGVQSVDLASVLPDFVTSALKQGFKAFGKKMKGYFTHEALLVGVESRTSSPVRIPRDQETLMHPQLVRLFPCGEGAGYAGGIVSAAMDGERCATAVAKAMGSRWHSTAVKST